MPRSSVILTGARERPSRIAIAIAILCCAGCGRPAAADDRDRVLHALDALRDAPGDALPERTRLLDALAATGATSPPAARARDTCVTAYRLLLSGTSLQRAVQADLTSDAGPAAATVPRVLDAERKINQSRTLMPDCERAIADLRLGPPS